MIDEKHFFGFTNTKNFFTFFPKTKTSIKTNLFLVLVEHVGAVLVLNKIVGLVGRLFVTGFYNFVVDAVFGKVIEGTEVILAISHTAVDADDKPKRPMRILQSKVSFKVPACEVVTTE